MSMQFTSEEFWRRWKKPKFSNFGKLWKKFFVFCFCNTCMRSSSQTENSANKWLMQIYCSRLWKSSRLGEFKKEKCDCSFNKPRLSPPLPLSIFLQKWSYTFFSFILFSPPLVYESAPEKPDGLIFWLPPEASKGTEWVRQENRTSNFIKYILLAWLLSLQIRFTYNYDYLCCTIPMHMALHKEWENRALSEGWLFLDFTQGNNRFFVT